MKLKGKTEDINDTGITPAQNQAVSVSPDIIRLLTGTRAGAEKQISEIGEYSRYVAPDNHPLIMAIERYKGVFQEFPSSVRELDAISIVGEDEIEFSDGTVLKTGYPKYEPNFIDIFEVKVKLPNSSKIARAIHFKNGKGLKALCREMAKEGFRLPTDGDELEEILDLIPGNNSVKLEILGRGLSGLTVDELTLKFKNSNECIWTMAAMNVENNKPKPILKLQANSKTIEGGFIHGDCGYSTLFVKRPIKNA